jgi:anti-sigma factor RsiW
VSCGKWEERIALYVEGDLPPSDCAFGETAAHLESCPACREFAEGVKQSLAMLRDAHQEPLAEAHFTAVRARVLERVGTGRRPRAWLAWAGLSAVAATLLTWIWIGEAMRQPYVKPVPGARHVAMGSGNAGSQTLARLDRPAAASTSTMPARERKSRSTLPHSRGSKELARIQPAHVLQPRPAPENEPLLVKLITDDPNVVIYWIADAKGVAR